MESIAADTLVKQRTRDRETSGYGGLSAVKAGVEAGDLRQRRMQPGQRLDRGNMMGLMKRCQRDQAA